MKHKIICILIVGGMLISGCSSKQKNVIAYASEFELSKYLELKEGESADIELTVDTKTVGTYQLKGNVKKNEKVLREIDEKVIVEDDVKPVIELLQKEDTVYEIPLKDTYQVLGNIEKISDKDDGEYKEISIVSDESYKDTKKKLESANKVANEQIFKTNKDIEKYKGTKDRCGYTLVTSNVNTEKAGTYTVHILTSDKSYNLSEVSYRIKVVDKDQKVSKDKLAAGASGSKMGKAVNYQVVDTTKQKEASTSENKDNTSNVANEQEVQNFKNNIVSNGTVSAQGSPVLQAALNLVGSHMMCDDLVTMALVNSGMITGTPHPIFQNGATYNIGVYQFPAITQPISASQARAGDLVYYDNGGYGSAHIAIYAGNGKAVHGGWMGMNVVVSTVNIGSGPRYMRFSPMSWNSVYKSIFGYDPEESTSGSGGEWTPPSTGGNDAPQTPSIPEWGNGGYQYMQQMSSGNLIVAIGSNSPIDSTYFENQVYSYFNEEISYEQLVANLKGKGYAIIDPF